MEEPDPPLLREVDRPLLHRLPITVQVEMEQWCLWWVGNQGDSRHLAQCLGQRSCMIKEPRHLRYQNVEAALRGRCERIQVV